VKSASDGPADKTGYRGRIIESIDRRRILDDSGSIGMTAIPRSAGSVLRRDLAQSGPGQADSSGFVLKSERILTARSEYGVRLEEPKPFENSGK
jgi:hypothetical protein